MNEELNELLTETIKSEIENLGNSSFDDDKAAEVDCICKLYKTLIEENKNAMEIGETVRTRESDERMKRLQIASGNKDRWVKLGTDIAGIILPLAFYGIWMGKGLKFEETGTFTSLTFKNLLNKFKPTKFN